MSNIAARSAKSLLALLLITLGVFGVETATATAAPAHAAAAAQPACGNTSSYTRVALAGLPSQATDTYRLIQSHGPFPYPQDGIVFQNRERILPNCSTGYYHEYTVKTPGSSTRGARRIVTGSGGEYFYTADHYASFRLITF
ncbi:ribonuclease domain-containing protein [Actinokineospora auranticolor]|uniref:Ribonuclease T1 n=1 Tax=Actinokineospora auranticolor TaxID=155976 RepID=A0A2S6GGN0_9PSEU|nr:ribonuclease domain-containing protein [Actinokineospora auranticolor]PPK64359.1 ribonuclease T1 [Actinokineospora auranticolor]